jgi:uncharacterized RDD family membrane protein YckC
MKRRAHPQQAGFLRRFFAFAVDTLIATAFALAVFFAGNEAAARLGGRTGELSRLVRGVGEHASITISVRSASLTPRAADLDTPEAEFRRAFLQKLRPSLAEDEFLKASMMGLAELERKYPRIMDEFPPGRGKIYALGGEDLSIIYELVCGYAYFILFFRFGGRTPGKRLFGLKVVSLDGRPRLGWYQAFERTHGYAASALSASLGFLQVLWDREGLTMHDKIADTTVVRWKRPVPLTRPPEKPEEGKT